MPPEQLALDVLMERSAFVARQTSTQEVERLRDYLHDAIRALEFEGPSKPCYVILSEPAGVLWARIVGCCALLGNVGADGSAEGASKFEPQKEARRVQEEFAPTGCFVETASHFLDDVGKKHSWSTALFKAQKGGKSLAPPFAARHVCAHPQACESWRREPPSATRWCLSSITTPSISRRNGSDKSVIRNLLFCRTLLNIFHVRCSCFFGAEEEDKC